MTEYFMKTKDWRNDTNFDRLSILIESTSNDFTIKSFKRNQELIRISNEFRLPIQN